METDMGMWISGFVAGLGIGTIIYVIMTWIAEALA
jgi:hypothetical protein